MINLVSNLKCTGRDLLDLKKKHLRLVFCKKLAHSLLMKEIPELVNEKHKETTLFQFDPGWTSTKHVFLDS